MSKAVLLTSVLLGVIFYFSSLTFATAQTSPSAQTFSILKYFGQTKDTETSRNLAGKKSIYHGSGVIVDKSSTPNKVFVVDTGNNRILGFNGAGYCSNSNQACTVDGDCGSGATCKVDGSKDADIVFGQDNFNDASCNRNNNLGFTKQPSLSTLCLSPYPLGTNNAEYWMRTNIDTDSEGSLYVTDVWNNRVLKYNQPFSSDKTAGKGDTIADFVIGQKDLNTNGVNRGTNYAPFASPAQNSLWFSKSPDHDHVSSRGVSVDAQKNIWVADTFNGRVLRFPPGLATADLVLGQSDFNSRNSACSDNSPLDKFCTPTLAKVNPRTGDLYVLDERPPAFQARILIFKAPFTNGMTAYKTIIPAQGPSFAGSSYFFQATGFTFNTYTQGEYSAGTLWINEHQTNRTILVDDNGNVIKVIGTPNNTTLGGDQNYTGDCGSIYEGFNLWAPGGSIGLDSGNNIYLADERFHRVSRYSLPYQIRNINGKTCLPLPNGGLFPGTEANVYSNEKLGESVGLAVFGNQLIILDEDRKLKVWNDYLNKSNGASPDYVITGTMPSRLLFSEAIDDSNRMWMLGEHGELKVYQLPFRSSADKPLADFIPLRWSDDNSEVITNFFESGLTFDSRNKALYLADRGNHRILRIKDYNNYTSGLHVDMVIGQPNKGSTKCNFNQEMPWLAGGAPTAKSLCNPLEVKFDKLGNLYAVESGYECHGNNRISVFMADDLKNAAGLFPLISAKKVFNQPNLITQAQGNTCSPNIVDKPGTPISIAFNNANQMYIGNDGYYGDDSKRQLRQLWFYADPLNKQISDGYIELPIGASGELVFDNNNNLIIQDHTWYRVWVVKTGQAAFSATVTAVDFNRQPLDLTGANALSTTLVPQTGVNYVDMSVEVNFSSGSPRNLVVRFIYQPLAITQAPTSAPTPTPTLVPPPAVTNTPVPRTTPVAGPTIIPTPTLVQTTTQPPVTISSATLNGGVLDLTGGSQLVATLTNGSSNIYNAVIGVTDSAGSTRNLVVRFIYQPLAITQAPTSAPTPTAVLAPSLVVTNSAAAPEMVYPLNGQRIDLEYDYMFKVKPVPEAQGYLFGLFQDGKMVYENYRDTGKLSTDGEFSLPASNPFHDKFHEGEVKVFVRASVGNAWTNARETTITLTPHR